MNRTLEQYRLIEGLTLIGLYNFLQAELHKYGKTVRPKTVESWCTKNKKNYRLPNKKIIPYLSLITGIPREKFWNEMQEDNVSSPQAGASGK